MNLPPLVAPLFQRVGGLLQYKPYPSYPSWLNAWDVSGVTGDASQALINSEQAIAAAAAAQSTADDATADALTAQSTADSALAAAAAAQSDADDALVASQQVEYLDFSGLSCKTTPAATYLTLTGYPFGFGKFTSTQNAVWNRQFLARAGTYEMRILVPKSSSAGIVRFTVDGVQSNTIDLYQLASDVNFQAVLGSLVLSGNKHDFAMEVTNKNASSSGYGAVLLWVFGWRTGD